MFSSSNVALIAKGNRYRGNKSNRGRQYKKAPRSYQRSKPKAGIAKKQKAKGNGEKDMTQVKCYNCGKKGHLARDCLKHPKVPFYTHAPELYVCSHALAAN